LIKDEGAVMKTNLCIGESEGYRFLLKEEFSEESYPIVPAESIEEALSSV
jgi:hypothetical protein